MPTQLSASTWRLHCRGVNAYLTEGPTLVDAGTPFDESTIRSAFSTLDVALADVERVLLTHYDVDHVGTLAKLAPDLDAPVYAHSDDGDLLAGRRKPPLLDRKGGFQRLSGLLARTPDLEVRPIEDGNTVGSFTAYHTPGHTPGHVAYVSEALDVAFLGDLVTAADGALEPSPWYLSDDTDALQASIVDLSERAPNFEVACVGHGDPITSGGKHALDDLAQAISRTA